MGADIAVFVKQRPDTGHVVITSLLTAKPWNFIKLVFCQN